MEYSNMEDKYESSLSESAVKMERMLDDLPIRRLSESTVEKLTSLYTKLSIHLQQNSVPVRSLSQTTRFTAGNKSAGTSLIATPTSEKAIYICELCNGKITIFNSDHDFSVNLHIQEEIHQQAVLQYNNVKIKEPVPDKVNINLQLLYSTQKNTTFHCEICVVVLHSKKSAKEHEASQEHVSNLLLKKIEDTLNTVQNIKKPYVQKVSKVTYTCNICKFQTKSKRREIKKHVSSHISLPAVVSKSGIYTCICCNVTLGKKQSKIIQHKETLAHKARCLLSPIKIVDENNF
ncbi:hypothetical protein C0J52_22129 [Blattella germanica]|nr:hypothetical protein C0J52_22129 [Blattella germanica]